MNKSSLFISITLIVLCVLWLGSGIFSFDNPEEKPPAQSQNAESSNAFSVEVITSTAQPFVPDIKITGRSQASRMVDLSAEVAARVKSIAHEKGEKVEEGTVIVELDTDDRQANVRQAQERVNQRRLEYEAAVNLEKRGFSSRIRSAEMKAELEAAKASLDAARLLLEDINVRAPFSGIVDRQYIEVGDYVNIGQELVKIVDLDPLEFSLFASERDVQHINVGQQASITLTDGRQLAGGVSFVAVSADPDTRTFPVEIEVPNESLEYKEGMTASIRLPAGEVQAHKLPTSSIVLNTEGDVGVRAVDENNTVSFVPLNILQSDGEVIWAKGLGTSEQVIVRGQDFVTDGDEVRVSQSDKEVMDNDQPDN